MLTKGQKKYMEEYEKYKDVAITPGFYVNKNRPIVEYEVLSVGIDQVTLRTVKTKYVTTKTLHWCRKNLMEVKR
tara:strand:+ start:592 stop:813 length:222 start_codon:yes stop_codon:yes gene_type:complete